MDNTESQRFAQKMMDSEKKYGGLDVSWPQVVELISLLFDYTGLKTN